MEMDGYDDIVNRFFCLKLENDKFAGPVVEEGYKYFTVVNRIQDAILFKICSLGDNESPRLMYSTEAKDNAGKEEDYDVWETWRPSKQYDQENGLLFYDCLINISYQFKYYCDAETKEMKRKEHDNNHVFSERYETLVAIEKLETQHIHFVYMPIDFDEPTYGIVPGKFELLRCTADFAFTYASELK